MLVKDIFKQLGREWVLELFNKAQNEEWSFEKLCDEFLSVSTDTNLEKFIKTLNKGKNGIVTKGKCNTGICGDLTEHMITGQPKTNSPDPDLLPFGLNIDIKTYPTFKGIPTEKLSVADVRWAPNKNHNEYLISTPFEETALYKKSQILLPLFDDSPSGAHQINKNGNPSKLEGKHINPLKRKFIGFKYVDLTTIFDIAKLDYEFYQNACKYQGESFVAFTIGSAQWPRTPQERTQVLHMKQAQNGKKEQYLIE